MGKVLRAEDQASSTRASEGTQEAEGGTPAGLPADWTWADLQALADKVYTLMLQDLILERERGLW